MGVCTKLVVESKGVNPFEFLDSLIEILSVFQAKTNRINDNLLERRAVRFRGYATNVIGFDFDYTPDESRYLSFLPHCSCDHLDITDESFLLSLGAGKSGVSIMEQVARHLTSDGYVCHFQANDSDDSSFVKFSDRVAVEDKFLYGQVDRAS